MKIYIKSNSSYIKSEISYMGYEIYKGVDGYHILDPSGVISDSDMYETESEAKEVIREQGTNSEASNYRKSESKNHSSLHLYQLQGPAFIWNYDTNGSDETPTCNNDGSWMYSTFAKSKKDAETHIRHRICSEVLKELTKVNYSKVRFDSKNVVQLY